MICKKCGKSKIEHLYKQKVNNNYTGYVKFKLICPSFCNSRKEKLRKLKLKKRGDNNEEKI